MANIPLVLNPDARLLWRSPRSIQIELGSRRVVVDGIVPGDVVNLLPHPDPGLQLSEATYGTKNEDPAVRPQLAQALSELRAAGFMVEAGTALRHPGPPRLATELAALRTRHGDQGADLLGARSERVVVVRGAGRLSPLVGSVLAAAGVGHVCVVGDGVSRLSHCIPGGLGPSDEGARFTMAAGNALHRAAPEVDARPPSAQDRVDLVILAGDGSVDPDVSAGLHRLNQAHLVVGVSGDRAVVGPTVVPGLSSCLRCGELSRLDRDEAWTALAAQLSLPPRHPAASDVALATAIGGLAAVQALAYLDGAEVTTIDATLELQLPDWRLRRRTWRPHSRCDCHFSPSTALTFPSG